MSSDEPDVIVIGAGQAGMAVAYEVKRRGLQPILLDSGNRVGDTWRQRWDSLVLFTPGRFDSLPGLPFPAGADDYPGKDAVADYLDRYARQMDLPIRLGTEVTGVAGSFGSYMVSAGGRRHTAPQVVIATGPFHRPVIPSVAGGFDPAVIQLHTAEYRNPAGLPSGPVLVVGAGNSGCQVARELSASRAVHLSAGDRNPVLPQRILGRDFFWWAGLVRFDRITAQSRLGRRLQTRDPVFGDGPRRLARRCRVRLHPRLVGAEGRTAWFTDGTTATVNSVVWATGFTVDHSLVTVPGVLDENGRIRQQGGVTSSRGLYTIGLPWQRTRGSALLGFVGRDAADITDRISRDAAAGRAAA